MRNEAQLKLLAARRVGGALDAGRRRRAAAADAPARARVRGDVRVTQSQLRGLFTPYAKLALPAVRLLLAPPAADGGVRAAARSAARRGGARGGGGGSGARRAEAEAALVCGLWRHARATLLHDGGRTAALSDGG